jgi:hypothetical protein
MVDGAASDDVIVVTLRYTGTLATRPRPYWCDNGTWQPITGTVAVSSAGSTLVFTLTNASSPTIFQLQGTPFTGVDSPPTAASVDGFAAEALPDRVRLTWQTLSEVGLTGFHLYRGTDPAGPGDRITGDPLPAQGMGALEGFAYSYEDLTSRLGDKTLYYWLEELRSDGAPVRHGPRIIAGAEGLRVFLPLVTQNPQAAEGEPEQEPPADSPPAEEPPDAAAGLTPGVYLPLITQQ